MDKFTNFCDHSTYFPVRNGRRSPDQWIESTPLYFRIKSCNLVKNTKPEIQMFNGLYLYHSSMFFRHLWYCKLIYSSTKVHESKYSESILMQYVHISKLMPSYFSDQQAEDQQKCPEIYWLSKKCMNNRMALFVEYQS